MPIDFQCSQCQHTLRVPDDSAGKKSRCPQCGNVQGIPYQPAPSPHAPPPHAPPPHAPPPHAPPPGQVPYGGPSQAANPYQLNPHGASPTAGNDGRYRKSLAEVQSRVRLPAIAILVVSILSMLIIAFAMFVGALTILEEGGDGEDVFPLVLLSIGMVMQLVTAVGAARMMVMKNYSLAMTASILCLVSGMCCQLALPFGIWALVILADSDVREQFS